MRPTLLRSALLTTALWHVFAVVLPQPAHAHPAAPRTIVQTTGTFEYQEADTQFSVYQGADSPADFSFPLSLGAGESLAADGAGFRIVGDDGGTIARIEAPWAHDANGDDVPASYSLDGDTIVMHVEHGADSAYPIVADPKSIVEDDEVGVIQTIRPDAPVGPPPDPAPASPAPPSSGGGGTPTAPKPVLNVNDPSSIMAFI